MTHDNGESATMSETSFVYGEELGSLVFLPEELAQDLATGLETISMLRTYGEARALELSAVWAPGLDDDDDEEHPDDDPYDARQTAGFLSGEWPGRASTSALDHWPEDLDDVGEETDPLGGTPYLFIDPADEATVVATISERGYRVRRDDRLFERMQLFSS
jgi:hypothetical protein